MVWLLLPVHDTGVAVDPAPCNQQLRCCTPCPCNACCNARLLVGLRHNLLHMHVLGCPGSFITQHFAAVPMAHLLHARHTNKLLLSRRHGANCVECRALVAEHLHCSFGCWCSNACSCVDLSDSNSATAWRHSCVRVRMMGGCALGNVCTCCARICCC